MRIETQGQYEAAGARAKALGDASEGTEHSAELAGLVSAIRDWQARREPEARRTIQSRVQIEALMICRLRGYPEISESRGSEGVRQFFEHPRRKWMVAPDCLGSFGSGLPDRLFFRA